MGLSFLAMGALLPQQGGFCWRRGYSTRPHASARCPTNTAVLYHRVRVAWGPGYHRLRTPYLSRKSEINHEWYRNASQIVIILEGQSACHG